MIWALIGVVGVAIAGWIVVLLISDRPTVDAGPDRTVDLVDDVTLSGLVADREGSAVQWRMAEGPWPVEFGDPTEPSTSADFLAIGRYVLEMSVSGPGGTSRDVVEINVVGPAGPHAAGLPVPFLLTTQRPSGGYFEDLESDFKRMAEVFNAITIPARMLAEGDLSAIEAAEAVGLVPIADTDYFESEPAVIDAGMDGLIAGFNAYPGRVPAIRLADELNEGAGNPQILLDYLAATACRIKNETADVLTLVDVGAGELRGDPNPGGLYSVLVLDLMVDQGCLDGFLLSNGSRDGDDRGFTEFQYREAKARWPSMLIIARTSRLSFAEDELPWSDSEARVDALAVAALDAGADGLHLWAWHQPTSNGVRKYLDADGSENALWSELRRLPAGPSK
ncbi:MAG: hypothetical protein ACR2OI_07515 [Acidimicrobiia bacterium]